MEMAFQMLILQNLKDIIIRMEKPGPLLVSHLHRSLER